MNEPRGDSLESETHRVDSRRDITGNAETEENQEELPEPTHGFKDGTYESADIFASVTRIP